LANEQDSVDPSNSRQDERAMRQPGQDDQSPPDCVTGERLVFFEYCISLIFISLRRPSALVKLRPGQRGWIKGLPYTILSLLLGWWCIPWGFIYTPLCLWTNLSGGRLIEPEESVNAKDSATEPG
jgi:hypothetical protein